MDFPMVGLVPRQPLEQPTVVETSNENMLYEEGHPDTDVSLSFKVDDSSKLTSSKGPTYHDRDSTETAIDQLPLSPSAPAPDSSSSECEDLAPITHDNLRASDS